MALPMFDQPTCNPPLAGPALALVSDGSSPPSRRPVPERVYWFRRVLVAALLLLFLWLSSLLASELRWTLSPQDPVGLSETAPAYVVVNDTAVPVSPLSD